MLKYSRICSNKGNFLKCWREFSSVLSPMHAEPCLLHENFGSLWKRRSAEASRSIAVEIESEQASLPAYHYCKQFGGIQNAFTYTLKDERKFVLFEYDSELSIDGIYKHSAFKANATPWQNQFLKLDASKLRDCENQQTPDIPIKQCTVLRVPVRPLIQATQTITEQILLLHEHMSINDVSIRLRFLATRQAQRILNEFLANEFPRAVIYPFGSSLSGVGKMGCDLDMSLKFENRDFSGDPNAGKPFAFYGKEVAIDDTKRNFEGRQVKLIASVFDLFLAGSSAVDSFHNARVPIVRYYDRNIRCSVDISALNTSGFNATELMYVYGALDPRVRPLIFLIRAWGKEFGITKFYPKDTFTNFHLSYMAISFLIQLKEPVLPTLKDLHGQSSESSPFLFDLDRITFKTENTDSLIDLFVQFLQFYEKFDMKKYLVTVRSHDAIERAEPSSAHLENVFEPESPWGINISSNECRALQIMCFEALAELEHLRQKEMNNKGWCITDFLTQVE